MKRILLIVTLVVLFVAFCGKIGSSSSDKKNDLTEEQQKAREEFYKIDKLKQPYKKGQFKEDGK